MFRSYGEQVDGYFYNKFFSAKITIWQFVGICKNMRGKTEADFWTDERRKESELKLHETVFIRVFIRIYTYKIYKFKIKISQSLNT